MSVYAKPYDWTANPLHNTALLDAFVAFPEFLAYPHEPAQARVLGAALLTDPKHIVFGTYSGPDLTGVIMLTRVAPRMDALVHFMFLDRDLVGKRKLLRNFIGFCFTDLGFQRLSMEVPDIKVPNEEGGKSRGLRLERFARKALGFRLEGETRDRPRELPKALDNRWMARQGSRRESAYFDGSEWHDVILLRLLASEWVGTGESEEAECRKPHSRSLPPLPDSSSAPRSEAEGPVTPKPPSPKTSSPSDSPT
jgi:hypothetical protein